jgi:hypothetical protein
MLPLFVQTREPTGFLQRLFTVKPGGIYSGDKVFIDVKRLGEHVAVVVEKCTGPNMNDISRFTTKEFTPPQYGEAFPMDACELLNRMAGIDPYSAAYTSYAAQLVTMMFNGFVDIDAKIARGIEQQASQILQTGILNLTDDNGATRYALDFSPKATHFPTVTTDWSAAGADPIADLQALAGVIRTDGKVDPNRLIMGEAALTNFLNNDKVQAALDNRRIEIGEIAPELRDSGATFYGFVWVGTYRMEIWAYPEEFLDPEDNVVKYIETDNVVMLSTRTRLDKASAIVPLPIAPDPRVAGLLPGRLDSAKDGIDVTPNVYASNNGKQVFGELESRPLLIPVQIDGFGCLTTKQ